MHWPQRRRRDKFGTVTPPPLDHTPCLFGSHSTLEHQPAYRTSTGLHVDTVCIQCGTVVSTELFEWVEDDAK